MAIFKVIVETTDGALALTFTTRKSAMRFAHDAAAEYGDDNVTTGRGIESYNDAEKALADLRIFGKPKAV